MTRRGWVGVAAVVVAVALTVVNVRAFGVNAPLMLALEFTAFVLAVLGLVVVRHVVCRS